MNDGGIAVSHLLDEFCNQAGASHTIRILQAGVDTDHEARFCGPAFPERAQQRIATECGTRSPSVAGRLGKVHGQAFGGMAQTTVHLDA